MNNLIFCLLEQGYHPDKNPKGHAQTVMNDLGITYEYCEPQSIADAWWFFDCKNIPDELPPCITYASENHKSSKQTHAEGMERVNNTPEPKGQKYPCGSRVVILSEPDVGIVRGSNTFEGRSATVVHTYAHAYTGDNVSSYCLDVDGFGKVSWFDELRLSAIAN